MIFVIHDPIHVQEVIVAIAEPSEAAIMRAVGRTGYHVQDPLAMAEMICMNDADGRTVIDHESGAVVIRLNKLRKGNPQDIGNLAHECVHAATMLFSRIGFPLEADTDEPLAYYVAFLVRSILAKL